jgi:hypothetical protein
MMIHPAQPHADASDCQRVAPVRSVIPSRTDLLTAVQKGKAAVEWLSNPSFAPAPSMAPADISDDHEKGETSGAHDPERHGRPQSSDPDTYLHAKKKLKKAVLEHYRYVSSRRAIRTRFLTWRHNYSLLKTLK